MISRSAVVKNPRIGLLNPGTLKTVMPPRASRQARPAANTLPADALRWLGRRSGGRFPCVAGAGAEAGSSVLCRENFTEGLPFIIGQDADVAVDGQTGQLVGFVSRDQGDLVREQRLLEVDQVRGLGRRVGRLGQPLAGRRLGRSDDLLEGLVLEPDVQDQVTLCDIVVDIIYLHRADIATQLVLDEVFLAHERPPLLLVGDDRLAERVALRHPDQGQFGVEHEAELMGLAQEAERVRGECGGGWWREHLVGQGDVEDALQSIGLDPDLTPGVVKLGSRVHQVKAIFQRDPHRRLQGGLEILLIVGVGCAAQVRAQEGMSIENDVLELGNLVDDLGNILHLPVLIALPLVDLREHIQVGLKEAHVGDHRSVRRQADLLLELVVRVSQGYDVEDQRLPGREHSRLHLVNLKLRQTRRLTLDELLIECGKLLEESQVPEIDHHLGDVFGKRNETDGRVRVAGRGEADEVETDARLGDRTPRQHVDDELLAELGEDTNLVEQAALGLGEVLEDHGAAGPAEERLHERQRQRRLHRRLDGVLTYEVEDNLIGKPHQQLAARVKEFTHARDLAQGQGRDLAAGRRPRLIQELIDRAHTGETGAVGRRYWRHARVELRLKLEPIQGHGERGVVQVLQLQLVNAGVDQGQREGLLQGNDVGVGVPRQPDGGRDVELGQPGNEHARELGGLLRAYGTGRAAWNDPVHLPPRLFRHLIVIRLRVQGNERTRRQPIAAW